ncbi:MAG: hypothetical protein LBI53_03805 [Candidatus Peribacteria bacterium]|nr:hypothetical protein [Candidatus Peribacteria bacterium]
MVGRERPHPGAALSLSRAIRIQPSARDATGCTAALAGTMKSVKISGSNGEKLCLCACADNAWQSLGNDNYLCPSICAGTTPPITDDPQCNDGVLGGCTVGSIVSVPTSQD